MLLARYIVEDKIDSSEKYNAAIAYLTENRHTAELNVAQFDKAAGVGVVTTEEDI